MLTRVTIFLLYLSCVACGREIRVKVIDEKGNPVEGAEIIVHYAGGPAEEIIKKTTNKDGIILVELPKLGQSES